MVCKRYIRMTLSNKYVDLSPVTQITKYITTNLLRTDGNFFTRPNLGYGYIIYFHAYHYFSDKKLVPIQYDNSLAIMQVHL